MMLCRISLSLMLISSCSVFGADQTVKVPYYIVNLHNVGFFGGKNILVPKSCFDRAVKTVYLVEGQHQFFGYEKKIDGYDVVDIGFNFRKDENYEPGNNKHKYSVHCFYYQQEGMHFDKAQLTNKHQVLKFIEDNAQAQLEKDLGAAATDGAVMY